MARTMATPTAGPRQSQLGEAPASVRSKIEASAHASTEINNIELLCRRIDRIKSGKLELHDVGHVMRREFRIPMSSASLKKLFTALDAERSGTISAKTLAEFVHHGAVPPEMSTLGGPSAEAEQMLVHEANILPQGAAQQTQCVQHKGPYPSPPKRTSRPQQETQQAQWVQHQGPRPPPPKGTSRPQQEKSTQLREELSSHDHQQRAELNSKHVAEMAMEGGLYQVTRTSLGRFETSAVTEEQCLDKSESTVTAVASYDLRQRLTEASEGRFAAEQYMVKLQEQLLSLSGTAKEYQRMNDQLRAEVQRLTQRNTERQALAQQVFETRHELQKAQSQLARLRNEIADYEQQVHTFDTPKNESISDLEQLVAALKKPADDSVALQLAKAAEADAAHAMNINNKLFQEERQLDLVQSERDMLKQQLIEERTKFESELGELGDTLHAHAEAMARTPASKLGMEEMMEELREENTILLNKLAFMEDEAAERKDQIALEQQAFWKTLEGVHQQPSLVSSPTTVYSMNGGRPRQRSSHSSNTGVGGKVQTANMKPLLAKARTPPTPGLSPRPSTKPLLREAHTPPSSALSSPRLITTPHTNTKPSAASCWQPPLNTARRSTRSRPSMRSD